MQEDDGEQRGEAAGGAAVEDIRLPSSDGMSTCQGTLWTPAAGSPKAIVQLVHGMVEHIGCYDSFARELCARGIAVCGIDQLGHGRTTPDDEERGVYDPEHGADHLIEDQHSLRLLAQERLPGLPHIMIGHSMGSFVARCYLGRHGSGLAGAVIMGTAWMAQPTLLALRAAVRARAAVRGWSYRSSLIDGMGVGSYNKQFEGTGANVGYEWLSRDEQRALTYSDDPDCGWTFSLSGYYTLAHLLGEAQDPSCIARIPHELPVFIASGSDDPVGDFGEAPAREWRALMDAGLDDVTLYLVSGARHELLNETNRDECVEAICTWMETHAIR